MIKLYKDTFEQEVSKYEGTVLVDFWSETCEPCKELFPEIKELDDRYGRYIKFCELDTTKSKRLAIKEKVLGLPAIVVYKNGKKIDEVIKDDVTKANIEKMIKQYL